MRAFGRHPIAPRFQPQYKPHWMQVTSKVHRQRPTRPASRLQPTCRKPWIRAAKPSLRHSKVDRNDQKYQRLYRRHSKLGIFPVPKRQLKLLDLHSLQKSRPPSTRMLQLSRQQALPLSQCPQQSNQLWTLAMSWQQNRQPRRPDTPCRRTFRARSIAVSKHDGG